MRKDMQRLAEVSEIRPRRRKFSLVSMTGTGRPARERIPVHGPIQGGEQEREDMDEVDVREMNMQGYDMYKSCEDHN